MSQFLCLCLSAAASQPWDLKVITLFRKELLECQDLTGPAIMQLMEDAFAMQTMLMTLAPPGLGVEETILTEMRKPIGILETMQEPVETMLKAFANRVDPNMDANSEEEFSKLMNAMGEMLDDSQKVKFP